MKKPYLDLPNILSNVLSFSVWKNKYAAPSETVPSEMHVRIANELVRIEEGYIKKENSFWFKLFRKKRLLSEYGQKRDNLTRSKIFNWLHDFKYIVPQGSIMFGAGRKDIIGSLSNCFVVGQPTDSYGGIMYKDQELAQLMKRRGGVGLDLSTLRPSGTSVSNAAKSSTGLPSYMERYSNTTREVAQDGRRGALMLTADCRHPDILGFINSKVDRTKVTGANISVMMRDELMEAAQNNEDYCLRWPCDMEDVPNRKLVHEYGKLVSYNNGYIKWIKAKELFDAVVHNAWDNAEPGVMFIDVQWERSPDTVYPEYKGVTTNPCGEIFMQPYDACRLLALNLLSFVKDPFTPLSEFDYDLLYQAAYEQQRLADDIVDLEIEHIDRIIKKIKSDPENTTVKQIELDLWTKIRKVASAGRRTGCGFTALGDTFAALGCKYGSEESKSLVNEILKTKMLAELDATIDLAILRGPFEGFNAKKEFGIDFMNSIYGKNKFYRDLVYSFPNLSRKMYEFGRRNVSWSTVAPTGTVSLMTQTTSGIEPLFQPFYIRRRKINPNDLHARIDFTDQNGDNWEESPILHHIFEHWIKEVYMMETNGYHHSYPDKTMGFLKDYPLFSKKFVQKAFEDSPWFGSLAEDIRTEDRIDIQRIAQNYTTHSISSTLNLHKDTTEKQVSEIYLDAWKSHLKGVTIYRDECRTGVLIKEGGTPQQTFSYKDTYKRPKSLDCDFYNATSNGQNYDIFIGLIDEKPYEVFARKNDVKNPSCRGTLTKIKSGTYKFESEKYTIENVIDNMTEEEELATRLISSNLRSGHDVKFLVEQLNKNQGHLTSFSKVLSRYLKKYIPDGSKSTVKCNECGGNNVIFEEGCQKCLDCGNSKCG